MTYNIEQGFYEFRERKLDTNKQVDVRVATEDNSPVFLVRNKELCQEGRVEFTLARKFGEKIYSFINHISGDKYEIYIDMNYLDEENYSYNSVYREVINITFLQNHYLIKEIVKQVSNILGKEILTKEDFLNFQCMAYINNHTNSNGVQESRFTRINVYKIYDDIPSDGSNYNNEKHVMEKSYSELNETDIEKLEKVFNLKQDSPMYKDKMYEISMFCKQIEAVENFLYRGNTFMRLSADLEVNEDSSAHQVHEYVMDKIKYFDIKPACIFIEEGCCWLEYMPKNHFHIRHWSDYLKLKLDFIEFLETINIEGVQLTYRPSDLDDIREIDENLPVLSNIKFGKDIFEHESIELYGAYAYSININNLENYKSYNGAIKVHTHIHRVVLNN